MKSVMLISAILASLSVGAQTYNLTKDIEDKYLEKIVVDSGDSLMIEYRNFAIDLFLNGSRVNDTIWRNIDLNLVGVCLYADHDSLKNRRIGFNLFSLHYRDERIDDFHQRIYFGEGSELISNFYVICNNEFELGLLKSAIDSYLTKDSIPTDNGAYQFSKNHTLEIDDYLEMFPSDSLSTIVMGNTYSYIRQNGNYLIQIESIPEDELEAGTEKIYTTDYFLKNWISISVFIIDESTGRAYNMIFE